MSQLFIVHAYKIDGFSKSSIAERNCKLVRALYQDFTARLDFIYMNIPNYPEANGETGLTDRTLVQTLHPYTQQNSSERFGFWTKWFIIQQCTSRPAVLRLPWYAFKRRSRIRRWTWAFPNQARAPASAEFHT